MSTESLDGFDILCVVLGGLERELMVDIFNLDWNKGIRYMQSRRAPKREEGGGSFVSSYLIRMYNFYQSNQFI